MAEMDLFLACIFATEKVGIDGYHDPQGISDWELAQKVKAMVETESNGRITVHITRDPYDNYISSVVRKEICRADLVLCLFTRRTLDHVTSKWLTSSYVVSEGAAYLALLPTEKDGHNRLFGLMEEGVDRHQLGMAFPANKTIERFRRLDESNLKASVAKIVSSVTSRSVRSRELRECLLLEKNVTVCRNGWVRVETRHRFKFTKAATRVTIPHSVWRISRPLPDIGTLLGTGDTNREGMLRVVPLSCGLRGQPMCRLKIVPIRNVGFGNERRFQVEAQGGEFQPGDELTYAVLWEYPDAFLAADHMLEGQPNSVGLRCGDRGIAQNAYLTLQFERDLDLDEPDRILETTPSVFLSASTTLPAAEEPEEFWHRSASWRFDKHLKACPKNSGARYEVYRWKAELFSGMAKVVFNAYDNYFHMNNEREMVNRTKRRIEERHEDT